MIRNIIFDVGKVLVSYEPDAYMQRLGISKENQKKINEAMFQNKLWDTSDQGLGTPDEFLQKFIAGAPELADEITKIHKTVGNTVELFPYAMEWILDLKARGYHVYILSNYSENMLDQTKDKLKFLPLMDGVVFSYKIKKMKPDPEIYEYLCDEYWLEPEESVFIDDRPVNIKGAETCGIHGIVFRSYEQAKRSWMSFLRNSNISVKNFSKTKIVIKWHTAIEFQKIASGENLKILGEA